MTKEEFKNKLGTGSTIVKFSATWCQPCKTFTPVLKAYTQENPHLYLIEVDIEDDLDIAKMYKVNSLPTTILFVDGVEKKRVVGVLNKEGLDNFSK